jgi:tetratricopeptide (TPR) repeat protein
VLTEFLHSLLPGQRRRAARLATARRHEEAGDPAAAERAYRELLAAQPDDPEALSRLGALLGLQGRAPEAVPLLERAAALTPAPSVLSDLGNAYWLAGRADAAERLYRRALEADEGAAGAHMNLGLLYRDQLRRADALAAFQRAYATEPLRPALLKNLVEVLLEAGRAGEAEALCREAAGHGRDDDELDYARGRALRDLWRAPEAIEHYARARRHRPDDPELLAHLAIALQDCGRLEEAAACHDRAIALKPAYRFARWHRSVLRLLAGDFAHGWDDYDLRLASEETPRRTSGVPAWQGEDLAGRSVLVYGEQGLGDELMFASCLPDVIALARAVSFEVSSRLTGLMAASFPGATVFAAGGGLTPDVAARQPEFEIPAGSLPALFRRSRAAFPAHQGYLHADPAAVEVWRLRLAALGPGPKVGVSWRGGTARTRQPLRSLQPADLAPVLQAPGIRCVNLQYGAGAGELGAYAASRGIAVAHWPEAIDDLAHMAALICALDLVVSVCNTTIHLAGALGRPAWVLAPRVPEWRYGIAGEEMPWYPSVHIFRQSRAGVWEEVVTRVATELARLPLPETPATKAQPR